MKSFLQILFFFLLIVQWVFPQWTNQNPVPDGNDLWSTFFIDDNTGWIVGSDGFIIKTTNAGLDWEQQNSGTNLTLKTVQFINPNTGWICGESGLLLKTTDGGQNWFELTTGTSDHLTNIEFFNISTGYLVGFNGTIMKTTDGGLTWINKSPGTSSDIYDIDFVNSLDGYAVGGESPSLVILRTTDGGDTWSDKTEDFNFDPTYILTVEFLDTNIGLIGGGDWADTYIFKTTDGGDSWIVVSNGWKEKEKINNREQLSIYNNGGINAIYFKDLLSGYAVGGIEQGYHRRIYTTTDGGSTWSIKYYGGEENGMLSVFLNDNGKGWAVGFTGVIFITEDNGDSWVQILSGNHPSIYSGDDIQSVFFINGDIGWAGGQRDGNYYLPANVILKTTNGGKIWKTQFFGGSSEAIRSVHFINEEVGWAIGPESFCRTTDGGVNWSNDNTISGSSIFFIDPYIGWIAADGYAYSPEGIFKSTDGGLTWVQKSPISSSSIYFLDNNTGFTVGEGGSILKSTDGGESWISKTTGASNDLNSIRFYDSNLGLCVGDGGVILISNNGGENWTSQSSFTTEDLESVTFTNSTSVWIIGSNGTILSSTDLGTNWNIDDEVTTNDLIGLYFINENTGWIGGMNGAMFKYQDDVVPVELISFTVDVTNNIVQLKWETGTEVNNSGFEIQRELGNRQSEAGNWKSIGFVPGFGTTTELKSYFFTDEDVTTGTYIYRLKQIDFDGTFKYSDEIEIMVDYTPNEFVLYQNYPNPFNPSTTIRFSLPKETQLKINVYNMLGELVETLAEGTYEAGYYKVTFSATGGSASGGNATNLPSGAYIYRIESSDFIEVKKMLLIK